MSGRYLLDTNAAIQVLELDVDLESRRDSGQEFFLCTAVVGELIFGAEKSARPTANRQRVELLLEICPMLSHDLETASHYGTIKARLRKKGRPIPENDLWIAACALQHNLKLATSDHHFDEIDGLQIEVL